MPLENVAARENVSLDIWWPVYVLSRIENPLNWSSYNVSRPLNCVKRPLEWTDWTKVPVKAASILVQRNDWGHFSWSLWFLNSKTTHKVGFFPSPGQICIVFNITVSSGLRFSQPCSSIHLVGIRFRQCSAHAAKRTLLPVWKKAWACVCTTCPRSRCSMVDRSAAMATWRRERSATVGSWR